LVVWEGLLDFFNLNSSASANRGGDKAGSPGSNFGGLKALLQLNKLLPKTASSVSVTQQEVEEVETSKGSRRLGEQIRFWS